MRVLHVGSTLAVSGGIESFIFNTYSNTIDDSIYFDFMVKELNESDYYADYVRERRGNIYICDWHGNKLDNIKKKFKVYRKYKNDIVHIHTNCGIRILDGVIAKIAGCKNIIFHSHTCKGDVPLKYKVLQPLYRLLGDYFFACSTLAAQYFFGEKVLLASNYFLIKNAIDLEKFKYNNDIREKYRKKILGCDDEEYVLGFVGRLSVEKNIEFAISIYREVSKKIKSKFIIVGSGEEENNIIKIIKKYNLENQVKLLGDRNDVEKLLMSFDGLIMPSQFEGLGISLIEAQATGLPCFTSINVPCETEVTNIIYYLSLNLRAAQWAEKIIEVGKNYDRSEEYSYKVSKKGYDIKKEAKKTVELYKKIKK